MFGLIRGEPGIGKTRLVYEFSNRARGLTHYWLTIHCSPFDAGAPFDPLISALSRNMGLDGVDDPGERSRLFDAGAQRHELDRQEQRAALAELLAVDVDKKLNCTTAQKRRLMIEALSKTLISPTTLTILHFEDIHWLDPSSLEVLEYIFSKGSKFPLLVLMTARPEFELPVSWKGMVLTINVERLLDADVRDLVGAMVESPAAVEELASRSDGIPLFAEALAKTHSESSRSSASVPQSLQELLYQSLDRLGDAKQIAQIAAVFGREFEVSQLLDVLDIGRHSLELQLAKLADSGLVFTSSPGHYVFKHALVQQLAYDSIPKRARRDLHLQIGELIADTRGDSVGPHVLAIHFSRARQHARAAELWLDAGRLAFRRSAYVEAANYLRTALEELPGIADELARDKQEITIQTYLGETLSALEGFAARSTQRAFERARELSEARNLTEEMFRAVSRLVGVAFVHSHNSHAHSLSSELQNIAKSMNDVRAMADADTLSGITAYQAGRFEEASDYFSRAVNYLISEQKSGSLMTAASHADAYQINTLWFLGKPDSAIRHAEAALARARSPAHPFNEAAVLMCLGVTRALRGEAELCRQVAFDLEALAREHNFMLHLGNAQCLLGMALSLGDDVERGIDELRMGLDTFDSLGQLAYATFYQSYLAGAYLRTDQLAHAESVLERTLDHAEEMGVNICTPELLRLTAELRLAQGEHQQADALLRRALALCDQQAARGAGLRVAISRLQAFPDVSDLRNDLKARLASFDEGLDTQDLRVAAQLVV
jgi:tetratricopeptide (TPR) repeat protein